MRLRLGLLALLGGCSAAEIGPLGPGADAGTSPLADARGPAQDPPDGADARPAPDAPAPPPLTDPPPPAGTVAVLEVHAMDIWAQYLPPGATLEVYRGTAMLAGSDFPVRRVALEPGDYRVHIAAPDHDPLDVGLHFDGTADPGGVKIVSSSAGGLAGVSLAHAQEIIASRATPVHRLFLGARHRWFAASGRPARRGNSITLFLDHEEAWSEVDAELRAARDQIHISSWWFDSSFELLRSASTSLTTEQRRPNTILAVLDGSPARKRVLIGQFLGQDGILRDYAADDGIRARGAAAGDRFEYMGQANPSMGSFFFDLDPFEMGARVRAAYPGMGAFEPEPRLDTRVPSHMVDMAEFPIEISVPHASMHQKFVVVDDAVAFVGGLNFHPDDWDGPDHVVFDARRMDFGATSDERAAVAAKERLPDRPPRKDYLVRIDGPAVQDVTDVFKARWDLAIAEGVEYAANASPFSVGRDQPSYGDVQVQITTTMPDPIWEHSIAESWLNAISQAERYIYIEDQYFRSELLNDAIYRRMLEKPDLRVVVVSMPVSEWTDPACEWTARSHMRFKEAFPDRYEAVLMRSFDHVVTWGIDETESRFVDVYIHSKMLIIDDRFMSVGSANKNNRGMIYEAEMNVAVLHPAWVRSERRRILAGLVPGATLSDDPVVWFRQLRDARAHNDAVYARWEAEGHDISLDGAPLPPSYTPSGFLYTLPVRDSSYCLIEGVGPDVM